MQASAPAHGIPWTLGRLNKSLFDTLFPNAHTGHRILASCRVHRPDVCVREGPLLPARQPDADHAPDLRRAADGQRNGLALGNGLGARVYWPRRAGAPDVRRFRCAGSQNSGGSVDRCHHRRHRRLHHRLRSRRRSIRLPQPARLHPLQLAVGDSPGRTAALRPALIWLATIDFGWPAEGKLFVDGMYIYMPGDITKILATSLAVTVLWNHGDRIIDVVRRRARELLGRGSSSS